MNECTIIYNDNMSRQEFLLENKIAKKEGDDFPLINQEKLAIQLREFNDKLAHLNRRLYICECILGDIFSFFPILVISVGYCIVHAVFGGLSANYFSLVSSILLIFLTIFSFFFVNYFDKKIDSLRKEYESYPEFLEDVKLKKTIEKSKSFLDEPFLNDFYKKKNNKKKWESDEIVFIKDVDSKSRYVKIERGKELSFDELKKEYVLMTEDEIKNIGFTRLE